MPGLGDEFVIQISNDAGLDELCVQVEVEEALSSQAIEAVKSELVQKLRAVIEVRPTVEVLPFGTIPRPEFKASRIRDARQEG